MTVMLLIVKNICQKLLCYDENCISFLKCLFLVRCCSFLHSQHIDLLCFHEIDFVFVLFCVVIIFMQRSDNFFFITIFYFVMYFTGMTAITEENSLSD